ncbi:MAG TPA: carboxypeptidase regulatory-like domain-containing protein [Blastocatellia bacterium]
MPARIVLAVLCVTAIPAVASAQNALQNNTIRGKVRTESGTTVNQAIVTLSKTSGGTIGEVVTGNDGDFTFTGLEATSYIISVHATGYEQEVQNVTFSQSMYDRFHDTLNVEVFITPLPDQALSVPPGTSFVQQVPKNAKAAYDKGVAKLAEGKSTEGIALLRQATDTFNTYFDANYALGVAYYRTGQLDDAVAALEKAREVNDHDGAVYHMFGLVMLKQSKFNVAEYAFRNAVSYNGSSPASRFYHGYALIEMALRAKAAKEKGDELGEANRELTTAWDLSNKHLYVVYLEKARIDEMTGDKEAAAKDLETYLKAMPDSKQAASIRQEIEKLRAQAKP